MADTERRRDKIIGQYDDKIEQLRDQTSGFSNEKLHRIHKQYKDMPNKRELLQIVDAELRSRDKYYR